MKERKEEEEKKEQKAQDPLALTAFASAGL